MDQPRTFEEFWPYYVRAHSNKTNRMLHFVGTSAGMALLGVGVLTRRVTPALLAPVVGYGMAWIGHFFVEGNKPATFGHPLWSRPPAPRSSPPSTSPRTPPSTERAHSRHGVTRPC
ncbi:MAG: DUF962 domain-containing protein [Polyangiaceae bacterium]|nr:DUF962 domain-containing protein [Polyangiaceae bacterium]